MYFLLISVALIISFFGTKANEPPSTKCQSFCPHNHAPVCGTNDSGIAQTFTNDCTMAAENCLKATSKFTTINCIEKQ